MGGVGGGEKKRAEEKGDEEVRSEYEGRDGARTAGSRRPLCGQLGVERWWWVGKFGRGAARRADPGAVLTAVLNSEGGLPRAVGFVGFAAARGIRARVLPLILNLGELCVQLNPEASYPGAES